MANFEGWLINNVGRTVVDLTGLTGRYDFTLEFAPDQQSVPEPDNAARPLSNGPSIFTALQEQLGLKLESRKHPIEMFVIDSAEKPSGN